MGGGVWEPGTREHTYMHTYILTDGGRETDRQTDRHSSGQAGKTATHTQTTHMSSSPTQHRVRATAPILAAFCLSALRSYTTTFTGT